MAVPTLTQQAIGATGRAALRGLQFGKRSLGVATAGALAPGVSALGTIAATPLGIVVGGAIGGVSSVFKNINNVLSAIKKQMDAREKIEEKILTQQIIDSNKQTSERLEDEREGVASPEDVKRGKGPVVVRLGMILRRMSRKAKGAVSGLFSKIPGASFVRGAIGGAISRIAGLGAATIIGWGLVIAGVALVIKFILDNIRDWMQVITDKIIQALGSFIPFLGDAFQRSLIREDVNESLRAEEMRLRELDENKNLTDEQLRQQAITNVQKRFEERGYSKSVLDELFAAPGSLRSKKALERDIKNMQRALDQTKEGDAGVMLFGQTDPRLSGFAVYPREELKSLIQERKKELKQRKFNTTQQKTSNQTKTISDSGSGLGVKNASFTGSVAESPPTIIASKNGDVIHNNANAGFTYTVQAGNLNILDTETLQV